VSEEGQVPASDPDHAEAGAAESASEDGVGPIADVEELVASVEADVLAAPEPDSLLADDDDEDEEEERVGADAVIGDYGVDAPGVVNGVAWAAGIAFFITLVAAVANALVLMFIALAVTIMLTFAALSLMWSSRVAKLRERVLIIDGVELDGGERVLDVGCGRGLLLVEVARRLEAGRVVGVDVWRDQDQSGNEPGSALRNAEIERVDERAVLVTSDARSLPFENESFDAVVSSMALHNIEDFDGRVNAMREIDRVLVPGGRLALVDFEATREYADALRACDWTQVTRSRRIWRMFPPVHYVTGTKPGGIAPEEPAEPEVSEPEVSEPEVSEPVVSEPVVSEPVAGEPEATDAAEPTTEPERTVGRWTAFLAWIKGRQRVTDEATEERDDSIWAAPKPEEADAESSAQESTTEEPAAEEPEATATVAETEDADHAPLLHDALVTADASTDATASDEGDAGDADEKVTEG